VDAVVVGGGHHGLVAAAVLADAGWALYLGNAAAHPGGGVHEVCGFLAAKAALARRSGGLPAQEDPLRGVGVGARQPVTPRRAAAMDKVRVCQRERGSRVVSEAWLAVLVPVALMAAALGMQQLEHHLLGPSPADEEDPAPRRARSLSRSAGPPAARSARPAR
jgi:monoamine oxidase